MSVLTKVIGIIVLAIGFEAVPILFICSFLLEWYAGISLLFSLLMILYFVRLVLYFPDGPLPMIYDHASLAGKLLLLTGIIR